jgi:CheY-like chemotaxis protein
MPPALRTLPLGSRVPVCPERGSSIGAADVSVPMRDVEGTLARNAAATPNCGYRPPLMSTDWRWRGCQVGELSERRTNSESSGQTTKHGFLRDAILWRFLQMLPTNLWPSASLVLNWRTLSRRDMQIETEAEIITRSSSAVVRILVVDDFEPFRRFLREKLQARPGLQIVGEASDGSEAVQKADELQPDLILLDIGLPVLNGIEAAHRICGLVPGVRILFVSQNDDADIVTAALNNGAKGYVRKLNASTELLRAVEAVLQGEHFVSTGLGGDRQSSRLNECGSQ